MSLIEQLEFKYQLNKLFRRGISLDELFRWPDFTIEFNKFLEGRIGQIWLKKTYGQKYLKWQES